MPSKVSLQRSLRDGVWFKTWMFTLVLVSNKYVLFFVDAAVAGTSLYYRIGYISSKYMSDMSHFVVFCLFIL